MCSAMTAGCLASMCAPVYVVSVVAAVCIYPAVFDVNEASRYGMTHSLLPSRSDFDVLEVAFCVCE